VILAVHVGVAGGLGVDARSGTGLLTGLDMHRSMRAGAVLVLAPTGLSAGFTTLSTVTDEQLAVAETGAPGQPAGSTALSVAAAPLAAPAGLRWLR